MENQRILVIGGNGYIGRTLVEKLRSGDFDVTVMSRQKLPDNQNKYIVGDLLDKTSLEKNLHDFDLVINLASVVRTIHKGRYRENIDGLKNLIEVMTANSLKRLIYFSSQNVNLMNKGPYATSKVQCEQLLKNSGLDFVIIRPSLVYGIDRQNDFYRLANLIDKWHVAPIIGSGENKIQPVLKEDVADATLSAIITFMRGQIIDVVGRDAITMNQVVDHLAHKLQKSTFKVHLPLLLLKIFKKFLPFDLAGYMEDRISKVTNVKDSSASFFSNLDQIIDLYKNIDQRGR